MAINPHIGGKSPYDALRDFTPIALIGFAPNVLVVHPSLPAKTVKDLIALAKVKPGALNYASNGSGTLSHLSGELFSQAVVVIRGAEAAGHENRMATSAESGQGLRVRQPRNEASRSPFSPAVL